MQKERILFVIVLDYYVICLNFYFQSRPNWPHVNGQGEEEQYSNIEGEMMWAEENTVLMESLGSGEGGKYFTFHI